MLIVSWISLIGIIWIRVPYISCYVRHSLVKQLEGTELDGPSPIRRNSHSLNEHSIQHPHHHHHHHHHLHHCPIPPPKMHRRASLDDLEQESCLLAPTVENRIIKLTTEVTFDSSLFSIRACLLFTSKYHYSRIKLGDIQEKSCWKWILVGFNFRFFFSFFFVC